MKKYHENLRDYIEKEKLKNMLSLVAFENGKVFLSEVVKT